MRLLLAAAALISLLLVTPATATDVPFSLFDVGVRSGTLEASAGDVNGDGRADAVFMACGPYRRSRSVDAGTPEVRIVFGRRSVRTIDVVREADRSPFVIKGEHGLDACWFPPFQARGVGDVNGDGRDDVAFLEEEVSRVHIIYGRGRGAIEVASLERSDGFTIYGGSRGSIGEFAASAGDTNGDGIGDVLIGGYHPQRRNQLHVVYGTRSKRGVLRLDRLGRSGGYRIIAPVGSGGSAGRPYTFTLTAASGDFDGDGLADVVVGAPFVDRPGAQDAGAAYLVLGRRRSGDVYLERSLGRRGLSLGGPADPGAVEMDNETLSYYGYWVSCRDRIGGETGSDDDPPRLGAHVDAADFDGDGRDEAVVGMPGADADDGREDVGKVYVVDWRIAAGPLEVAATATTTIAGARREGGLFIGRNAGRLDRGRADDLLLYGYSGRCEVPAYAAVLQGGQRRRAFDLRSRSTKLHRLAPGEWDTPEETAFDFIGMLRLRDWNGDGYDDILLNPRGGSASGIFFGRRNWPSRR